MVSASFTQTNFLGGEWSALAQGRMADPAYKTGLNIMSNFLPLEAGAAVRRPGARFLAHTKGGLPANLLAFDFEVTQPYQLELTNHIIRFYAGLSLLTWRVIDGPVIVDTVLPTNPVKIVLNTAIPAGWANGATVIFQLPSVPATCTDLLGRQFVVANIDTGANTFTLKNPITGADVDGTSFVYNPAPAGSDPDTVERIFELTSPYGTADIGQVRAVQQDDNVLLIHPLYQQRLIEQPTDGSAPFTIAVQDFEDGPYLDIPKDTTTTLSLSGVSGSVTVTASATTDINNGDGFKTTDVGRLIRFQGGPAAWNSGTTYAKAAVVLGSDNNIYTSLQGGNINHDPTTDNTGTYWQISPNTVAWTWLKITAWSSTTVVTAQVLGDSPLQGTATTQWQLGLYCDTLGWPAVGTYHEGRLWLAGRATDFTNRVDGSFSNDPFNFAPTADDGTVSAANGVSAIFRAKEANIIFWMLSTDDGLMLGAQAGEWRIRASVLDDPITPTSIQARRVSTYGCADVQPAQPGGQTVFVQRQQRRLLAHQQITGNRYSASNLSQNADHVSESGFAEIMWQQEPLLCVWARRTDGALVGCTYQERQYSGYAVSKEPFNGWHRHTLAGDRDVTSIQSGPAFDGLSDAIYMVTNQPDEDAPDFNVHWVQVLMPVFDATVPDYGAYYTDGGATPPYAQLYSVANGDSFDGIRIFGLWSLNGQTIAPVVGGLDLGDRTVANGFADVAFGTDPDGVFTLAFFTALSNGTDYGVFEVQTGYVVQGSPTNPDVPANCLLGLVGPDVNVIGSRSVVFHTDRANSRILEVILPPTLHLDYGGGLRLLDDDSNSGTFGDEILQADNQDIFGPPVTFTTWDIGTTYAAGDFVQASDLGYYVSVVNGNIGNDPVTDGNVHWHPRAHDWELPSAISYLHADGFLYATGTRGLSNTTPMSKINATTLVEAGTYGSVGSGLGGSGAGHLQLAFTSMAGLTIGANNYLVFCGIRAAGVINEVTILQTDGAMAFRDAMQIDEHLASVTRGPTSRSFFATGQPFSSWPAIWNSGTTYAAGTGVYGSDGLAYTSAQSGNTNHNPVGDNGTWWTAAPQYIGLYQFQYDEASSSLFMRKIKKIGPKDIDSTWSSISNMIGPATDGNDIVCLVETSDSVTNQHYLVRFSKTDGSVVWKAAIPETISNIANQQSMSVADFSCHAVYIRGGVSDHNAYIIDMETGALTTQALNTGFSIATGNQQYDCATGSVTANLSFTPPGSGPAMTYLGDYLANNSDTLAGQYGRLYLGLSCCGEKTITTYTVPVSLGSTYTSDLQLLRPDSGNDAGARNGPAFGKIRRVHWDGVLLTRSRKIEHGTEFDKLKPLKLASDGGIPVVAPGLFSGIASYTVDCNYSFTAQLALRSTRPYPCNVGVVAGYLALADK
jgi:hypothetical protein